MADTTTTTQQTIKLEVWSDYVCPFCYLEIPVFEDFAQQIAQPLEIDWHAFELRPAPEPTLDPKGAYLHRVWEQSVYPMAKQRGLALKLPPVQPYSKQALAAAEYAKDTSNFEAFHQEMFRAFFEQGQDISNDEVIAEVAQAAGLEAAAVVAAAKSSLYQNRVDADRQAAIRRGVSGVPAVFMSLSNSPRILQVSGAADVDLLLQAAAKLSSKENQQVIA
ncbi:MAG: DsbA family protein [Cyanobacteria bacterium P01_H01_bin.21]